MLRFKQIFDDKFKSLTIINYYSTLTLSSNTKLLDNPMTTKKTKITFNVVQCEPLAISVMKRRIEDGISICMTQTPI